jgi:kinetochor protein Mis14/NSL1
LVELGQLRRAAPVKAAEAWKAELGKPLDAELDTVKYGEDEAWEKEFTMEKLERQEDVEKAWRAGVEGLGKLKRELPATAARMERAKGGGAYALKE